MVRGDRGETGVTVVTGASAGVGRAAAIEFARRGDRVALLARGAEGLRGAARDVSEAGGDPSLPLQVDVADHRAVEEAAQHVEDMLGPIDVWVNAAFTTEFAPFWDIEEDEFRRITEVTYLGYVHGTKAALRRMRPRDRGVIVQVGSALAHRGIPLQSAYCGAKHAILGMHESLRTELMHEGSGVGVTMVQLPALNTPQFDWAAAKLARRPRPVPPIFQPEVAGRAVVAAAVRPSRERWIAASTIATVIGNRWSGGLMDRYLARTGYESQQTDEFSGGEARGNLWEPMDQDADYGVRGRFDDQAYERSLWEWFAQLGSGAVKRVRGAVRAFS